MEFRLGRLEAEVARLDSAWLDERYQVRGTPLAWGRLQPIPTLHKLWTLDTSSDRFPQVLTWDSLFSPGRPSLHSSSSTQLLDFLWAASHSWRGTWLRALPCTCNTSSSVTMPPESSCPLPISARDLSIENTCKSLWIESSDHFLTYQELIPPNSLASKG